MRKENEVKINSTLTKCVVKSPGNIFSQAPGSCGTELATIYVINFQKLVAYPGQWQTSSGGPDQIQVAQNKKS